VQFTNVLAVLMVDDFDTAASWYERFFDRGPDRRPMDSCAEWDLAAGGAVQVFGKGPTSGGSTVVLGVDDVDARAAELAGRGIEAEVYTTPGNTFRLATTTDPAGNTVMLGQTLAGG
jgi:predicted enzyme related to lactoylglutathione lyase